MAKTKQYLRFDGSKAIGKSTYRKGEGWIDLETAHAWAPDVTGPGQGAHKPSEEGKRLKKTSGGGVMVGSVSVCMCKVSYRPSHARSGAE